MEQMIREAHVDKAIRKVMVFLLYPYNHGLKELSEIHLNLKRDSESNTNRAKNMIATLNGEDRWMRKRGHYLDKL